MTEPEQRRPRLVLADDHLDVLDENAQEEERSRIARELHDDLSQQIAALSIAMGNLKRHIPEEQSDARTEADRIHQRLVGVSETVRRISHELHPAILYYSGLAATPRAPPLLITKPAGTAARTGQDQTKVPPARPLLRGLACFIR